MEQVKEFKKTILYIKECDCGYKYFGKTTDIKNIYNYKGSGKIWKLHLKKNKCKIKTTIYSINKIKSICMIKALHFSICNDIIKNNNFKNLNYENGLDGGNTYTNNPNYKKIIENKKKSMNNPETKKKLRQANLGKKHSLETRKKQSKSHKGKIKTKEHCENLSKSLTGNIIPQNVRNKISNTLKNKIVFNCKICNNKKIKDIGNNWIKHLNSKIHLKKKYFKKIRKDF